MEMERRVWWRWRVGGCGEMESRVWWRWRGGCGGDGE